MYISLNGTLVVGANLSWEEFVMLAANTGFGGVDVNVTGAMEMGLKATKRLLAKTELKPAVIGLPVNFRQDEAKFTADLKKLPEAAQFGVEIGCPRFSTWLLPSYDEPAEVITRRFRDRLSACAEVLARHEIRFGLEFVSPLHWRQAGKHIWKYRLNEMLEFAESCGPNVGVLLDSWHWHHAGSSIQDILDAGKDRIMHVQVADAPDIPAEKIRDFERLLPGEGVIDFDAFFGALGKIGYQDGVSPEIFGRTFRDMLPADGAELGLYWTHRAMRVAGIEA